MLDTLDDVLWMLPFPSKKQAQIIQVRQVNLVTYEELQKRSYLITAEHRIPAAREQLEQNWKVWIAQDAFKARRMAATRAKATAAEIPEYDA